MQIGAPKPERLADAQAAEPQQHEKEPVAPRGSGSQQGLDLGLAYRNRWPGSPLALDMTRACPVTNTRALGLQLRREVAVVADLVYSSEHRCVEHPVGDGVLVELPHGREQMVDPPGAAHTALSGAGALDRCRLQHHHEQPERSRPSEEVPPAPLTPRQVAGEVAGIRACRTLSSISAETEVTVSVNATRSARTSFPAVVHSCPRGAQYPEGVTEYANACSKMHRS